MKRDIKQKANRHIAKCCSELETSGATPEQVKIAKKHIGWLVEDVLEIFKITLKGK